jgi:hypothetical protein
MKHLEQLTVEEFKTFMRQYRCAYWQEKTAGKVDDDLKEIIDNSPFNTPEFRLRFPEWQRQIERNVQPMYN